MGYYYGYNTLGMENQQLLPLTCFFAPAQTISIVA